jgi:hypothetical protein
MICSIRLFSRIRCMSPEILRAKTARIAIRHDRHPVMFRVEHRNPGNGHNLRKIRSFDSTLRGTPIARTRFVSEIECLRVFFGEPVRPAKAGVFSGSQSRQGKSQSPVTWVAFVEETKRMKPTDKAINWMASESSGRNASEPNGGLDKK